MNHFFIHLVLSVSGTGLGIGKIKIYSTCYLPKRNNAKEWNE